MAGPLKLHVGCGERYIPGWVNIDKRALAGADVTADAWSLPFERDSADVLYACHVLEHLNQRYAWEALQEWHRVLVPGGTLRISVPNFAAWARLYLVTHDMDLVQGSIHGRQDYPANTHYVSYDFTSLQHLLDTCGFIDVKHYDWRATEHADIDDFSQAYYPHMDKDRGTPMSLNVEATA